MYSPAFTHQLPSTRPPNGSQIYASETPNSRPSGEAGSIHLTMMLKWISPSGIARTVYLFVIWSYRENTIELHRLWWNDNFIPSAYLLPFGRTVLFLAGAPVPLLFLNGPFLLYVGHMLWIVTQQMPKYNNIDTRTLMTQRRNVHYYLLLPLDLGYFLTLSPCDCLFVRNVSRFSHYSIECVFNFLGFPVANRNFRIGTNEKWPTTYLLYYLCRVQTPFFALLYSAGFSARSIFTFSLSTRVRSVYFIWVGARISFSDRQLITMCARGTYAVTVIDYRLYGTLKLGYGTI